MKLISTILGGDIVAILKENLVGQALLGPRSQGEISTIIINALKGVGHSYQLSFGKDQIVTTSVLEKIGNRIPDTNEKRGFRQFKEEEKIERIFQQVKLNTSPSIDKIQKNAALYCAGDAGSCDAQIFGNYFLRDDSIERGNLRFVQTIDKKVVLVFNEVRATLVDIDKPIAEFFVTREVTVGPEENGVINIDVKLSFRQ